MHKFILIIVSYFVFITLHAQDSSCVQMNKQYLKKNDTLSFFCDITKCRNINLKFATLNVWIENVNTHKKWKLRYPIFDNHAKASLVIDTSMADGVYAFNFLVQRNFFTLEGQITNYRSRFKEIEYAFESDTIKFTKSFLPNADGSFKLKSLYFEDMASFSFSPSKKDEENDLIIHIKSSLDSSFTAETGMIKFIEINNQTTAKINTIHSTNYQLNVDAFTVPTTLPDVTVETKAKKEIEKFNEMYSTGLFKSDDAKIIDCINNNTIKQSVNFLDFIKGRIAGLTVTDMPNNQYLLLWRGPSRLMPSSKAALSTASIDGNSNVDIFIDEQLQDISTFSVTSIDPHDIAMIKAYPPPAFLSAGGSHGAIAIYTNRGKMEEVKGHYDFELFGYNKPVTVWKK